MSQPNGPRIGGMTRILHTMNDTQDTSVTADLHGTADGKPRLSVLCGHILTYCLTLEAVTAHAQAWTEATAVARRCLPERARPYGTHVAVLAVYTAHVSQTIDGRPTWSIARYAPATDPGHMSSLWVRVGQLTIRALDIAAVDSIAQTWTRAVPLATTLLTPP